MSDLKLSLIMSARERMTGPLSAVMKGSKRVGRQLGEQRKELSKLQKQQDNISSFKTLESATENLGNEVNQAQAKVDRYRRVLDRTGGTNKAMTKGLAKAERELTKANKKYSQGAEKLSAFRDRLKESGLNTADLTSEQKRLTESIESQTKSVEKLRSKYHGLKNAQERINKISAAGGKVLRTAAKTGAVGLAALGAGGYLFKSHFLDVAASFETLESTLKTIEGSSSKARSSMNWITDFAAKTPYDLEQVTESFVKLRAYGMDPTNGLLQTLGDTSSAMGKDVMQAVEAIADAITGENERLKEFGVRASKGGGQITYEYTDNAGKQQTASVKDDDRKAIEQTLKTIWNEKFAGAMRERSRTWVGMTSNMSDHWNKFALLVMNNGLFDWMKEKLSGLLDKIDQMASDGSLEIVAKQWGANIQEFASDVWDAGTTIVTTTKDIIETFGGVKNVILGVAALSLAPLIASVFSLAAALGPVGLVVTGVVAAFTGLRWVFNNWDKVKETLGFNFDGSDDFTGSANTRRAQRNKIKNNTAPVNGFTPVAGSGGGTVVQQMTIQTQPGMDEAAVGREVTKALEEQNRRSQRERRSRMRDSD